MFALDTWGDCFQVLISLGQRFGKWLAEAALDTMSDLLRLRDFASGSIGASRGCKVLFIGRYINDQTWSKLARS